MALFRYVAGFVIFALLAVAAARAEDAELARYDAKISAKDREHWAFRPVARPPIPAVKDINWPANAIDAFILAKLEAKGTRPARTASPRDLIRRLTLDLIGLPPTPEETEAFIAEAAVRPEAALQRLVDRLLASPHYGERWARHWLDVARYAETNGYERDAIKPQAWKYRDYVIDSFNRDLPFDRFVIEQIAGDEIAEKTAASMIATGFHRVGPWDDEPADPKQDRFDQLDDMVRTTSSVFLGLTLGCARCHDHKFEPITTLDYYRMVAIFDPLVRPVSGRTELDGAIGNAAQLEAQARRDRRLAEMMSWIAALRKGFEREFLASGRSKPAPEVQAAFRVEPDQRDASQKALVEKHNAAFAAEVTAALPEATQQAIAGIEAEAHRLRAALPDLPRGYFFEEAAAAARPETHLLIRGQATNPGPLVAPGFPAVLVAHQPDFPDGSGPTSGRRLRLARWLTAPEQPLTARVLVNRVWQFHFGVGLVRTPSDFGTFGEPPTHPELLDWLASWFVDNGWSIKKLHRLIVSSATYRMGREGVRGARAADPEDLLYSRFPYARLDAETIRDAMLAVSGTLDPALHGPSVYPEIPREAIAAHPDRDKVWKEFDERKAARRTVYAMVKRSLVVPMLEVLDFCDTTQSAPKRDVTSTAPQALTLLNGAFVNRQARHFAERLKREVGDDPARQVERAFLLALNRPPTAAERDALLGYLATEASDDSESITALTRACRVIFNMNEFVYPN